MRLEKGPHSFARRTLGDSPQELAPSRTTGLAIRNLIHVGARWQNEIGSRWRPRTHSLLGRTRQQSIEFVGAENEVACGTVKPKILER